VNSTAEGVQALRNGSVDALITGPFVAQTAVYSAEYPNFSIGSVPADTLTELRFAVTHSQRNLREAMDARLASMTSEEHAQLRERWLPSNDGAFYSTPRTRVEERLVQQVNVLRVGYITGLPSISDTDELGHLTGVGPGYVADIGSALGLRLQFVYTGSAAELSRRLTAGEIDVAIEGVLPGRTGAVPTMSYLRTPLVIVTRKADVNPLLRPTHGARIYLGAEVARRRADVESLLPHNEFADGDVATSIRRVERGEAIGFVGSAATVDAFLQQHPDLEVRRALLGARDLDVVFWVTGARADMVPLINRAMANLTATEHQRIRQGYGKYAYSAGPPWQVLMMRYSMIGIGVLGALAALVISHVRLRAEVGKRKRAEEELIDRAHLKRTILETLPYPLVAVDTFGRVQSSNSAYGTMFGPTDNIFAGSTPFARLEDAYWQTPPIGEQVDYLDARGVLRHGIYYQRSRVSSDEKVLGAVAVLLDLTEWREAEDRAARYRRELDLIIQNVPARMYQLREEDSGARHFTIVAGDPDDLFGPGSRAALDDRLHAFDIVYEPDRAALREALASARAKKASIRAEFRTAFNPSRWIRTEARPQRDQASASLVWHGYWIDVTDKYEQEAALILARQQAEDAVQAKGRFLALMSHEIRTPMQGMLGMIDVLRETATDSEARHMLGIIDQSALSLRQILDDVLDYAKLDEGQLHLHLEDADLREVVEQTVIGHLSTARSKSLKVEVHFDGVEAAHFRFDRVRVRQILSNLLSNAIKFTDEGIVTVRLDGELPDQGRQTLVLSVGDSGIGIPAEEVDEVFEAFHQAIGSGQGATGGTGLGLAICRQLARLLDGELTVESELGQGSVFSLRLTLPIVPRRLEWSLPDLEFHVPLLPATRYVYVASNMLVQVGGRLVHQMPSLESGIMNRPRVVVISDEDDHVRTVASGDLAVVLSRHLMGGTYKRAAGAVLVSVCPLLRSALLGALRAAFSDHFAQPELVAPVETGTGEHLILLVEDNEVARQVIARQIQVAGWRCLAVSGGLEALEALKTTRVSLVLTDIQMPGLDGYQWVCRWRAWEQRHHAGSRLPVFALTAMMQDTQQAWKDAGMDGYLTKPVRVDDLRKLSTHLRASASNIERVARARSGVSPLAELADTIGQLGGWPIAKPLVQQMLASASADLDGYEVVRATKNTDHLATWLHRSFGSMRVFGERALCDRASQYESELRIGAVDEAYFVEIDTLIEATRQWLTEAAACASVSAYGVEECGGTHKYETMEGVARVIDISSKELPL
jgi:signal transduction histidine kinase/CheY-like chemotaxis protein/ABC-type amino acid transport substrate-binding protein